MAGAQAKNLNVASIDLDDCRRDSSGAYAVVDYDVCGKTDVRKRRRRVGRRAPTREIRARHAQKPAALRKKPPRPVVVRNAKAFG